MNDARLFAGCLALSAGVMVMVSFVEILPEATELFTEAGCSKNHAFMINVAIFFCGCLLCLSLDMIAQFIANRRQRSAKELEHCSSEVKSVTTPFPIGGILAWLALANILTPASIAVMMSVTAGIMVYVGVVKLQKEAISRDPSDTWSGYGFILGMAVMALSLVLFKIR
ncbi:Zinc transporter [Perkinsus olseni]|uniref:Zinc transporter n=1 Tax=Perkinsus olseni TaxID=32597 RepID=A0A7J6MY74_PEROL|nr:Zinc transporter [Perkinsus olseni]